MRASKRPRVPPGGVARVELARFVGVLAVYVLCVRISRRDDVAQPHRVATRLVEAHGLEVGHALGGAAAEGQVRDETLPAPQFRVAHGERLMLRRSEEVGEQVEDLAPSHDSRLVHQLADLALHDAVPLRASPLAVEEALVVE